MSMLFTCQNKPISLRSEGKNNYKLLEAIVEKSTETTKNIMPKIHRLKTSASTIPGPIKALKATINGESVENPEVLKATINGKSVENLAANKTTINGESVENPTTVDAKTCQNTELNMKDSTETVKSNNDKTNTSNISNVDQPIQIKDGLPKFGPFYFNNDPVLLEAREEAWNLVLRNTHVPDRENNHKTSEDKEKIKQDYVSAMRNVEKEAIDAYAGHLPVKGSDFYWMMIKDGCFFIQLALVTLGGAKALGHPANHVIFGHKQNRKKILTWLDAMFFVGNQIPLVVLQELMKQSFFKQVIVNGKWETPSGLSKRVLYDLLVLPSIEIENPNRKGILQWICCKGRSAKREEDKCCDTIMYQDQQQPRDVLQGLRCMILGPINELEECEPDEIDLEANWKESTSEEKWKINATSLKKASITIKHIQGVGTRGIYIKKTCRGANLYLPSFIVDDDTELVLKNLQSYEINQSGSKNNREVCSYIRFMSDIICTLDDVRLLESQGIIMGSPKQLDKLPGIMRRLNSKDLTQHLYNVKMQISSYSAPVWRKWIRYLLNGVAALTLIQTFYTMLGYHHKAKC